MPSKSKHLESLVKEFIPEPEKQNVKRGLCTLPNLITILGILFSWVYLIQIVTNWLIFLAPVSIAFVGTSDLLDGLCARKLNKHTFSGKFLDYLRDKSLVFVLCFSIIWLNGNAVLPVLIWAFCETFLLIRDIVTTARGSMGVHTINKIGQAAIFLGVGVFLVQQFWLTFTIIELPFILWSIVIIALLNCIFVYYPPFSKS